MTSHEGVRRLGRLWFSGIVISLHLKNSASAQLRRFGLTPLARTHAPRNSLIPSFAVWQAQASRLSAQCGSQEGKGVTA
jgi:hypothetical protein